MYIGDSSVKQGISSSVLVRLIVPSRL